MGLCGREAPLVLTSWDSCLGAQPATSSVQAHLLLWELQLLHALLGPQEASDKISSKTAERRQDTLLHLHWLFPKHPRVIKLLIAQPCLPGQRHKASRTATVPTIANKTRRQHRCLVAGWRRGKHLLCACWWRCPLRNPR